MKNEKLYLEQQSSKLHNENLKIKIFSFCKKTQDKKETNFLTITQKQKDQILKILLTSN